MWESSAQRLGKTCVKRGYIGTGVGSPWADSELHENFSGSGEWPNMSLLYTYIYICTQDTCVHVYIYIHTCIHLSLSLLLLLLEGKGERDATTPPRARSPPRACPLPDQRYSLEVGFVNLRPSCGGLHFKKTVRYCIHIYIYVYIIHIYICI